MFGKLLCGITGRIQLKSLAVRGLTSPLRCGVENLQRIYVHEQDHSRKVRFEVTETPKKPLQEVIANKLNLCCGRCQGCLKLSS